jgi:hypothetical protein
MLVIMILDKKTPPADPTNPLENNQSYEWTVNLTFRELLIHFSLVIIMVMV